MKDINKKIDKIDKLVLDDNAFNSYIKNIEDSMICIPSDLNTKIFEVLDNKKLNEKGAKILQKHRKINYLDIVKIAACTTFAVLIWQNTSTKEFAYASSDGNTKRNEIYTHIDNFMDSMNSFFTNPIDFKLERRNK